MRSVVFNMYSIITSLKLLEESFELAICLVLFLYKEGIIK